MPKRDDPHKLGLMIAIGTPKRGSPPPSPYDDNDADDVGQDPGDQQGPTPGPITTQARQAAGGKVDRGSAGYVPMEQACGACLNYHAPTSTCAKVEGEFRCCDACTEFFQPANPNYLNIQATPPMTDQAAGGYPPNPAPPQGASNDQQGF